MAIVDADLQGSVTDLKDFLSGVDVHYLDSLLNGKLTDYDLIVIDTPPYLSSRLTELFALSDYVLVPTKAGILDAMAIRATIALLQQSMQGKPSLKAGIVLNMVLPRTSLNEEVKEILTGYEIPLLLSRISQRVSYTRQVDTFSGITLEIAGSNEMDSLCSIDQLSIY